MLKSGTFIRNKYYKIYAASLMGWVVTIIGEMADSVIAGLYLDSEAVAAVELIGPIFTIIYFFGMLISSGCGILYSKALGAFNIEDSEKIAGTGLIVSASTGLIMAVVLLLFKEAIINFYAAGETIISYANDYYGPFVIIGLIYPAMWTLYYLVGYDGDEVTCITSDIAISLSNVIISIVLVQKIGIGGLGLGTMFSNVIGFALLIMHFFKKTNSIHFKFIFSSKNIWNMLKVSSSTSLTILYVAVVDIIFNAIIIKLFGDEYLPAYTVVNALLSMAAVLLCATEGSSIFVAVGTGEKNPYSIRRAMKLAQKNEIILSIIFSIGLYMIAPVWADLYGIEDANIIAVANFAGKVIPFSYLVAAFVYMYLSYYPIINKSLEGNIIAISYMLIGPVVLAMPLAYIGGFNAMSIGFALTPVFAIVVFVIYAAIKKQFKKLPLLLDDSDEKEAQFDISLESIDNIIELRNAVALFLQSEGVSQTKINEVQIVIEESLVHIKNKNKKKVLCECVVLLGEKYIRLITKDNGVIFDMSKEADSSIDLGCYVLARMIESASENSYTTTTSFNRNTYIWER